MKRLNALFEKIAEEGEGSERIPCMKNVMGM